MNPVRRIMDALVEGKRLGPLVLRWERSAPGTKRKTLAMHLAEVYASLQALDDDVQAIRRALRERREPEGAPVSVTLFAPVARYQLPQKWQTTPEPEEPESPAERPASDGWVVTAKTVWMQPGQQKLVEFMPQRVLAPGGWVFVTGPALLTNLLVGQDTQTIFAPSYGAVGRIGDTVPIGCNVVTYLEWAGPDRLK